MDPRLRPQDDVQGLHEVLFWPRSLVWGNAAPSIEARMEKREKSDYRSYGEMDSNLELYCTGEGGMNMETEIHSLIQGSRLAG